MSFCCDDDDGNDAENGGVEILRLIMMKFDVFVSSGGDVTKIDFEWRDYLHQFVMQLDVISRTIALDFSGPTQFLIFFKSFRAFTDTSVVARGGDWVKNHPPPPCRVLL